MAGNTPIPFDANKFELIHQVGGIRTATYDWPDAGGAPGCRVAMVDTGSGLRFTVALDRGGDIVEAFYQSCSLAYLTPNGYRPPRQPLHRDEDWLAAWPGGLLTSCGPRYIGPGARGRRPQAGPTRPTLQHPGGSARTEEPRPRPR